MPRRASNGPRRAIVSLEFVVTNMMTQPEIRAQLEADMVDPKSSLYRYLAENYGWRPKLKTEHKALHAVHFRSPICNEWRGLPPEGK